MEEDNMPAAGSEGKQTGNREKRKRTTAKAKFTRTLNVLKEKIGDGAFPEILNSMYEELNEAYNDLELKNDEYMAIIEGNEQEVKEANIAMEKTYKDKCDIYAKFLEIPSRSPVNERTVNTPYTTVRVKKLDAPKFSGMIRHFPTFIKESNKKNYEKLD